MLKRGEMLSGGISIGATVSDLGVMFMVTTPAHIHG